MKSPEIPNNRHRHPNHRRRLSTILKDHLGSTDVIFTGAWNGNEFTDYTTERQAFSPWGERCNASTFITSRLIYASPFRTSTMDYDRGYTGHEQLDDSGLIHMNGRLYDPELGRMLSPDPVVQVPKYSQNFNRYSYVMNNPLNLTDPTGFSWISKAFHKMGNWLEKNWKTVVAVVVAVMAWYAAPYLLGAIYAPLGATGASAGLGALAAQGAVAGAIAGGFNAGINGGDLGDVLRGVAVGAIQGAIAGGVLHGMQPNSVGFSSEMALHVAGHGVLGGAANVAMGGKFQDGFLSAAVSAGALDLGLINGSIVAKTIKAGIVGGTASALGGGKFANGAWTAAFQYLTNDAAGRAREFGRDFWNGLKSYTWSDMGRDVASVVGGGLELADMALERVGFGMTVDEICMASGPLAGVEGGLVRIAAYGRAAEETVLMGKASSAFKVLPGTKYAVYNAETNLTFKEIAANLKSAGFGESVIQTPKGPITLFEGNGVKYSFRDFSGQGSPTLEYFSAGSKTATMKLRLGGN